MLGDVAIFHAVQTGEVIIHPYEARNVGSNSYDVRLGEFYYREQKPQNFPAYYNIYSQADVRRVWGLPQIALDAFDVMPPSATLDTLQGTRVIVLQPGETILAHTEEFIGGVSCTATEMSSRSSMGRSMIGVCKCAGLGDVGYVNRWTMEITNFSRWHHIPLVVGRRIAQIVFDETGRIRHRYGQGKEDKYQDPTADMQELIDKWTPDMMLPRLDRDWELTPQMSGVCDVNR